MTDLYDLLEVNKSASKDEIKKAYKKAAIKFHPDKLRSDATEEEKSKFIKIHAAYEVLIDDDKRYKYDMYGITDDNIHGMYKTEAGQSDQMHNILNMFFRNMDGFTRTGNIFAKNATNINIEPIIIDVFLSIEDVIFGAEKDIIFERNVLINITTNKSISTQGIIYSCEACKGSGSTIETQQYGFMITQRVLQCSKCKSPEGKSLGYVNIDPNKYKFVKKRCKLTYIIKKGMKNKETISIKNIGHTNPIYRGKNGDVILNIKYEKCDVKKRFKLDINYNLVYNQQISVFESITGTKFDIKHPDGRFLTVKIPPVMHNFRRIVKKFGIPQQQLSESDFLEASIAFTDLIIIFDIIYPIITYEQEQIIKYNFEEFYHVSNDNDKENIFLDFT